MARFIDMTGQNYGRWTVLSYSGSGKWNCICECGTTRVVSGAHLRSGASKSCGCYEHEQLMKRNTTHGENKTPLHCLWLDIKKRCSNPNYKQYKDYGGRGIRVCEEWANDFLSFKEWAISNGYRKGLTIDRIDNDKGYSPDNCRFVDRIAQGNNKRNNRRITVNGETKTLAQYAREYGINESIIRSRIKRGWAEQDSVLIPVHTFNNKHSYQMAKGGGSFH